MEDSFGEGSALSGKRSTDQASCRSRESVEAEREKRRRAKTPNWSAHPMEPGIIK